MRDFRNLNVWENAHALTLKIYKLTTLFPGDEQYGLTSQLRRAVASIPTNIAEGCGRNSDADLARFLDIAMGSASETEYLLCLACDLGYVEADQAQALSGNVVEIKRMLTGLIKRLRIKK